MYLQPRNGCKYAVSNGSEWLEFSCLLNESIMGVLKKDDSSANFWTRLFFIFAKFFQAGELGLYNCPVLILTQDLAQVWILLLNVKDFTRQKKPTKS